jgi:hypothetical protein
LSDPNSSSSASTTWPARACDPGPDNSQIFLFDARGKRAPGE